MQSLVNFKINMCKSGIRILKFKNDYVEEIKVILEDNNITFVDFDNFITILGDRQCMKALYILSNEFYISLE